MIALTLKFILAYFWPWLLGYLALRILDYQSRFSRGLVFFAALGVGMGIFTLEIFALGILGLPLSLGLFLKVLVPELVVLGAAAWYLGRLAWPWDFSGLKSLRRAEKILLACFILILLFKVAASAWQILHVPVYEFDAWNNWDLRAKVIFTQAGIPLDKTQAATYLGGGISSYPLHDPLWKVWVATVIGAWHEELINLYSVVFYICLVGLFFFSLPENWKFIFRLILTYVLASLPFLYFHSWVAYADLEFATYLFLSTVSLFWFLSSPYLANLILSALTLSLAIWTKNEGFAVVAPIFFLFTVVLVLTRHLSVKHMCGYWLTVLLGAAPWLIFRSVNRLDILSGDSSSFSLAFNSHFFSEWFSSVFLRSHFNFLWLFLILLSLFLFRQVWRDGPVKFLASLLGLLFLAYNSVILFTDRALDMSALVRVNLHLAPVAWFLTAVLLDQILAVEKK